MSAPRDWHKLAAIATVLTLITSSLIGGFGVYLGAKALDFAARSESARIRPIIRSQTFQGYRSAREIENIGGGPAIFTRVVYVWLDAAGNVQDSLVFDRDVSIQQAMDFMGLGEINQHLGGHEPVIFQTVRDGFAMQGDEIVSVLRAEELDARPAQWRARFIPLLDRAVFGMGLCIDHVSTDGVPGQLSINNACAALERP